MFAQIDRVLTGALDQPAPPVVRDRPKKTYAKKPSVVVGCVRYPMLRESRSNVWRVRKRTKDISVDFSTGLLDLDAAKDKARETLSTQDAHRQRRRSGGATLQEVAEAYRQMAKRCSPKTAEANINRLEKIVEEAWDLDLGDVRAGDLTAQLWSDYAAKRQGGKLDLSTRTHENRGINSAIRMAVSLFHVGLESGYGRAGISLNFEAVRRVEWLPEIPSKLPTLAQENVTEMMLALPKLKETNRPMWRAVMSARYAGLRSREISGARKSWMLQTFQDGAGVWSFAVRDRPEEGWWHKTGADYTAPIMSPELVEDLLSLPDEGSLLVETTGSRDRFFRKLCNEWLRKFIPRPNKGLHRLRALYAEEMQTATASAALARQKGVQAAQEALGHSTSKTTERSYLPAPA